MVGGMVGDQRLLASCKAAAASTGPLDQKSMLKVGAALERFQKLVWIDGLDLLQAVAMLLALVSDQLVFVGGPKKVAFERLLASLEELLHQIGPDYKGLDSFLDACTFDGLLDL
jgi:hypothetical protein